MGHWSAKHASRWAGDAGIKMNECIREARDPPRAEARAFAFFMQINKGGVI